MKHTNKNYYLKMHHPRCVIFTINETVLLSQNIVWTAEGRENFLSSAKNQTVSPYLC